MAQRGRHPNFILSESASLPITLSIVSTHETWKLDIFVIRE
jgi:hypothetical protein